MFQINNPLFSIQFLISRHAKIYLDLLIILEQSYYCFYIFFYYYIKLNKQTIKSISAIIYRGEILGKAFTRSENVLGYYKVYGYRTLHCYVETYRR